MSESILDPEVKQNFDALTECIRKMSRIPLFLIVEDDESDAILLAHELEMFFRKCQIMRCQDGIDALAILSKSQVDAIFLDLKLPRMGGIELMRSLKQQKKLVLIIVTALDRDSAETLEAIKLGAVKVIAKPVTQSDLKNLFTP